MSPSPRTNQRSSAAVIAQLFAAALTAMLLLASCDLLGDLLPGDHDPPAEAPSITAMSLCLRNSMILLDDGTLLAAGSNGSGELGSLDIEPSYDLRQIRTGVAGMMSNGSSSFFLMRDGGVFVSGSNTFGQLGTGSSENYASGTITLPVGAEPRTLRFAGSASIMLGENGEVWVSGDNYEGAVRNSTGAALSGDSFQKLSSSGYLEGVASLATNSGHAVFVLDDGTVWACGENADGRLGTAGPGGAAAAKMLYIEDAVAAAAGKTHSLVLEANGDLFACGSNAYGQLGGEYDPSIPAYPAPGKVMSQVSAIAAGDYTSYAITERGDLYASGLNDHGQVGNGSGEDAHGFVKVMSGVAAVAAGPKHAFFLKKDGTLWAVGHNYFGQLGDCTVTARAQPVQIYYRDSMSAGGN
jgi:hypothetical protein